MIYVDVKKQLHGSDGEMNLSVSLELQAHSFNALAGVSGSGKSTLLRIFAGLEEAEGKIEVNGEVWLSSTTKLPVQKRKIGFVFQDYSLFANMSVEQNLLYVSPDKELALKLLEMTHLSELKHRYPNTLSGGQQQRVALCRAMMQRPKLLLMDEPLSALDPKMRSQLQHDILSLHQEFQTTTIMVSHDPSEIYKLAQRVIVLQNGEVTQDGTPQEVLLQTYGSQKFVLQGELLEIIKADVIHIAVVAIGQQIVEVVLDANECARFKVGDKIQVSTKAFSPTIH